MNQPPSLLTQPSDFKGRKRQSILFESYYRHYLKWFEAEMLPTHRNATISNTEPKWLALAIWCNYRAGLKAEPPKSHGIKESGGSSACS